MTSKFAAEEMPGGTVRASDFGAAAARLDPSQAYERRVHAGVRIRTFIYLGVCGSMVLHDESTARTSERE